MNLKDFVTDIFHLDDLQNVMDRSVSDKATIVKAVVKIANKKGTITFGGSYAICVKFTNFIETLFLSVFFM